MKKDKDGMPVEQDAPLYEDGRFKPPDAPVLMPFEKAGKKEFTGDARSPSVRGPTIEALSEWARTCANLGCPIDGARLAVPLKVWHEIRAELKKTMKPGQSNFPFDATVKLLLPGGWLEVGEFKQPGEQRPRIISL